MQEKGIKEQIAFPRKMLFNNFSPGKIEDRKRKFENYLNKLAELINLVEFSDACNFLEMEEHTRTLLSSLEFDVKPKMEQSPFSTKLPAVGDEELEDFTLERREGTRVSEFLKKLNREPLTIAKSVQEFEAYFFEKSLILNKDEVKQLLWGNAKLRGLLYFCGDTQSYIARNSCMQLLSKFFKYEYNSVQADTFVEVFSQTEPDLIRQMNLDYYIKGITSLDGSGLLSLYYYMKCNVHGITEPQELLKDKESANEYLKWLQNKITCGYLFKMSVRKSSSKGTMAESKEDSVEDTKEEDYLDVMSRSLGDFKVTKSLCEESNMDSAPYINYLTEQLDGYASWNIIESLANDTIKLYSKGKKELRLTLQLKTDDPQKAARYIFDTEKLARWANQKCNVIRREGESQDVVQILCQNVGPKPKYSEYIVYRTMKNPGDGQPVLIIERSLPLGKSEDTDVKRVQVNGCIKKLSRKVDTDGQKYVECQILIAIEEGYLLSMQYLLYTRKELEFCIAALNKQLQL